MKLRPLAKRIAPLGETNREPWRSKYLALGIPLSALRAAHLHRLDTNIILDALLQQPNRTKSQQVLDIIDRGVIIMGMIYSKF